MDKATRPITMLTIRELLRLKDKRLKVKGWKKIFMKMKKKKSWGSNTCIRQNGL